MIEEHLEEEDSVVNNEIVRDLSDANHALKSRISLLEKIIVQERRKMQKLRQEETKLKQAIARFIGKDQLESMKGRSFYAILFSSLIISNLKRELNIKQEQSGRAWRSSIYLNFF
jgi:hypothetical protein